MSDTTIVSPEVLQIVRQLAGEMAAQGAVAVLLVGSHARGEAHAESDIDLIFIGREAEGWLERRKGRLVSISWHSPESIRSALRDAAEAGGMVPALRKALVVQDPQGIAAGLVREAGAWTWDSLDSKCDLWVAEQITGYAEEVHRLVGCLEQNNLWMAAVVRSVLATRLAMVLAVHLRLLYGTENELWERVNLEMGEPWTTTQGKALGLGNEPFHETCRAALELYAIAAAKVRPLLSERQFEVVAYASGLAGHPPGG